MGFIKDATKFDTGRTMNNYFNSTMASITQVSNNRTILTNQIAAMKSNGDFTQEDWEEVQQLLNQVNEAIAGLK